MTTVLKRTAKSLSQGQVPSISEGAGSEERGDAKIVKARKKTSADNPAPALNRKPEAFDEHLIRERAYAIWVEEGRPDGRDVEHWIKARVEIEREAA